MATEDFATENQIKRLYAVLHSLGYDPAKWKKGQNIASYAKLTRGQCSDLIDELEFEEAGKKGKHVEAEETIKEDIKNGVQNQIDQDVLLNEAHAQAEISRIAVVMTFAAREAKRIVEDLANGGGINRRHKGKFD